MVQTLSEAWYRRGLWKSSSGISTMVGGQPCPDGLIPPAVKHSPKKFDRALDNLVGETFGWPGPPDIFPGRVKIFRGGKGGKNLSISAHGGFLFHKWSSSKTEMDVQGKLVCARIHPLPSFDPNEDDKIYPTPSPLSGGRGWERSTQEQDIDTYGGKQGIMKNMVPTVRFPPEGKGLGVLFMPILFSLVFPPLWTRGDS